MALLIGSTILTLAAVSGLGIAAAVIGWRGRAVDRNPVCRRCRFDLVGVPGAERCPECGGDLSGRRAVRVGNRVRRRGLVAVGVLVALVAGAAAGVKCYWKVNSIDWQKLKPEWLLLRELRSTNDLAAGEARSELLDRISEHRYSGSGLDRLLADFIRARAAIGAPVDSPLGNRLEGWESVLGAAAREGILGPEASLRLLEDSLAIEYRARSVAPADSMQPLFWRVPTARICGWGDINRGLHSYGLVCRLESITCDKRRLEQIGEGIESSEPAGGADGRSWIVMTLPPGEHALVATWTFDLYLSTEVDGPSRTVRRSRVVPVTVVEPGRQCITLVTDESLEPVIASAARVRTSWARSAGPSEDYLFIELEIVRSPVPVVGRVSLRWPEGFLAGVGYARAGGGGPDAYDTYACVERHVDMRLPDTVDVVITPDPEFAAMESMLTKMWGREVVVPNVSLRRVGQ